MHTAIARWNQSSGRWEAFYRDRLLASSRDKEGGPEYLKKVIEGGFSQKAKALQVTKVDVIGVEAGAGADVSIDAESAGFVPAVEIPTVESEFPINERFDIMESYVEMVASRELASTIVTGEGGLGKSYTVMRTLRKSGLEDLTKGKGEIGAVWSGQKGFVVVKGFSTAKGLFRTLYENRDQIIVFDDCDNVLRDPNAVNILKAALDSYDTRIVTWNAEGWGDDDLPKTFEFTGGVIFVSNMAKTKVPQAIRSRAMSADVSMTRDEVIERMRVIVKSQEFMPDYEMEHKLEALEFVAENAHNRMITELNLRSLVNVIKTRASKPDNWKRIGLYAMANA